MDVSHAIMEVMCEQLQTILYTFHKLQATEQGTAEIERGTAERTDLKSSSQSSIGVANSAILKFY